jgi:PAS domain S-box-containing protein
VSPSWERDDVADTPHGEEQRDRPGRAWAFDEEVALRAIVEGTAADTGQQFFASLVEHLARALDVRGAWIAEYLEKENRLRARAFWLGDGFVEDFEYELAGTPCEVVVKDARLVHVPDGVIDLFPDDSDLAEMSAVSYMGIPLLDVDGRVFGNLAVLDTRPMPEDARVLDLFRIFADRAVAELRRMRAEDEAREHGAKLERLLDSAMDAIVELHAVRRPDDAADMLVISRANRAAEQLFGCGREVLLGRSFTELLTESGADTLCRVTEELTSGKRTERYLWIPGGLGARRDDGSEFPAEATLSAFERDGERFYTLILRDVNDRLEAERRIESLEGQTAYLREQIQSLRHFDRVVGRSHALLSVLKEVDQVAGTDATVLVLGETGTGKELIARAIHEGSRRRREALITLNCAAIPANLIESELFGHEKGAFTGASERREGRFALADRGTLFLDEVGELPLELQGKLLRVLQEGEFEPVGSARTRTVDVRLVAATNRDLKAEVAEGRFREDLYYRLAVFPIRLPPLRERDDDVVLLASELAARFGRDMGREIAPLDEAAKQRLRAYPWPGNVRELQNVIERAVITAEGGRLNLDRALPEAGAAVRSIERPRDDERILTVGELQELERANVVRALEACDWKVSGRDGAAAKLGMNPSTLTSRIKALGIRRPRR